MIETATNARRWSNFQLKKFAPLYKGFIVNVSAWNDQDKEGSTYKDYFSLATEYYTTNFNDSKGFKKRDHELMLDLTKPLHDHLMLDFDVAFNHTTLEHIFDVRAAFKNICLLSRQIVIIITPWVQKEHFGDDFFDYWRLTPQCIKTLFITEGFNVTYQVTGPIAEKEQYIFTIAKRKENTNV